MGYYPTDPEDFDLCNTQDRASRLKRAPEDTSYKFILVGRDNICLPLAALTALVGVERNWTIL
jgi:hypothetical protein